MLRLLLAENWAEQVAAWQAGHGRPFFTQGAEASSAMENPVPSPPTIDGKWLERMARVARGFPGRTISVEQVEGTLHRAPRMSIDGVAAAEVLTHYASQAVA